MASDTNNGDLLDALYRDLALALGDAVWAFARIEWLTYECLERLSHEHLEELVSDLNFRPRTSIVRRIIERREIPAAKKDRVFAAIKAVDDLSVRRNLIVHNPWRIWIDFEAREFMSEIQRYSQPNKKLNLGELKSFAEDCGRAEVELRESLNAL
jgi:hypothetical protein